MLAKIKSVFIWTAIGLITLLWLPLISMVWLFERTEAKYWTGYVFRKLGHSYTFINPLWKINIHNSNESINPREPYIVVCNHQSHADVPLISRLPWDMKWVSKSEIFDIPIVGWMMKMARDIPVFRQSKRKKIETLKRAQTAVKNNCSVMFFPEGTRSRDGRVLKFTDGAFIIAIKNQVPILPMVIDGSSDALPKSSWVFNKISHVHLEVLEPIQTKGLTMDDLADLRDNVRHIIMKQLADWRQVDISMVDSMNKKVMA